LGGAREGARGRRRARGEPVRAQARGQQIVGEAVVFDPRGHRLHARGQRVEVARRRAAPAVAAAAAAGNQCERKQRGEPKPKRPPTRLPFALRSVSVYRFHGTSPWVGGACTQAPVAAWPIVQRRSSPRRRPTTPLGKK